MGMIEPAPIRRRFYSAPAWLINGLLVVQGLLWLSDRFQWPTWHKGYAVLIAVAGVGVVFVAMLLWLMVAVVFRLRFQFREPFDRGGLPPLARNALHKYASRTEDPHARSSLFLLA
jgi:hypothetical protein